MSDKDVSRRGQSLLDPRRPLKPVYDQAHRGGKGHLYNVFPQDVRSDLPVPAVARNRQMSDIPAPKMRILAPHVELRSTGPRRAEKDKPLRTADSNQSGYSWTTWPFDTWGHAGVNCAANATTVVVTLAFNPGIRAKIERFGWYTVGGAAAAALTFGLYVGGTLVAPGGRYVGGQQRTILDYNVSGGSIDPAQLNHMEIPVEPNTTIEIRATNATAIVYVAYGRIMGRHWEDEPREDGRSSFYNEYHDKIM